MVLSSRRARRAALSAPFALAISLAGCADSLGNPAAPQSVAPLPSLAGTGSAAPYAYRCAVALAPDPSSADQVIRDGYRAWKSAFLTGDGAGGHLRVRVAGYDDGTPSEGIGYGMLLAAYLDDRATFDGLWGYARSHLNENGLMAWKIDAQNRVVDEVAATDGDEDIAFALVVADQRWGGYRADAVALIGNLRTHAVEAGTYVFKPGDIWGGSKVTNPSYFAPAYYKVFAEYTGDSSWEIVADKSYEILDRVAAKRPSRSGLQPGWTNAAGDPVPGFDYSYEYNATRVPWRLAKDAAWYCDERARAHLDDLNAFFRGVGARNIRDGYALDGTNTGRWHNASFVAPPTAGALLSDDAGYRREMWDHTVALGYENYYDDSLRLLSLLLASGRMPHPFENTIDSFESGSAAGWSTYAGGGGSIVPEVVDGGAQGSPRSLRVDYRLPAGSGAWAGVQLSYWSGARDWSASRGLEFHFHGTGSGNRIQIALSDNGSNGSWDTAEVFTYRFKDDFTGWKSISVPWSSFQRGSWQRAGAPDDGLTLREVWGLAFEPVYGTGSFRLDQIRLLR